MKKYPAKIFYCYSHKDEELRDRLEVHLKMLERQNLIRNWHDRKIILGKDWSHEISKKLNDSDIILLLLSPDFLASDYCYEVEMKLAMELHAFRKVQVVPILLRICDWKNSPFSKLQGLPLDMIPVLSSEWDSADEAFQNIAEGLKELIQELFDSYPEADYELTKVTPINKLNEENFNEDHFLDLDYKELRKADLDLRSVNHKLRQRILPLIYSKGSVTITDIYSKLGLEQSVASQHLAILRRSGVINSKREGKYIYYRINMTRIKEIANAIKLINESKIDT